MKLPRTTASFLGLSALAVLGMTTEAAAAGPTGNALLPPINTNFAGNGTVASNQSDSSYNTQFLGSSTGVLNMSGLTFTGDDLSLYYSPTGFDDLVGRVQPDSITVDDTFAGTDILTTADGTVDFSLSGTYTGPSGSLYGEGGAVLSFTGTATITGGTLGLTGSTTFNGTETEVEESALAPLGSFAPFVNPSGQPPGPASYTANYGTLTSTAVPEPSSVAAFTFGSLGLLGLTLRARRQKRSL